MSVELSVIILTYNEERHIKRCIERVKHIAAQIYIVDSYSADDTVTIAKEAGAEVIQHEWPGNQAEQFNWALDNLPLTTDWILRLDADEYLLPELKEEIKNRLSEMEEDVNGVVFKRRHIFLGKWIKRGTYPVHILRLFRYGKARYKTQWMDEHLQLTEGETTEFEHDFVDHNLHPIGWWIDKHNNYSIREAVEYFDWKIGILGNASDYKSFKGQKEAYYGKPLFLRAFIYFLYRYIFKRGFLEGKQGFLWHFLQGWWYRTLVDAKIFEVQQACGQDPDKIREYIRTNYNLDI